MDVVLENIGKRYQFEWIFRHVNYSFQAGKAYAILGPNGSGKSTLMKVLSTHLTPSKGKISYHQKWQKVKPDEVYLHVSFAAPYIELIEEFTLLEALCFHNNFKPLLQQLNSEDIIHLLNFSKYKNKEIRHFSSGMKQRLKLALAICSDTSILLLDEPSTNLDKDGIEWYHQLISQFAENRLVVIASNVETDYSFCTKQINITDFKNIGSSK